MALRTSRERKLARLNDLSDDALDAVGMFLDVKKDLEAALAAVGGAALPGLPELGDEQLRDAVHRNEARVWAVRARLYESGLSREQAAKRVGVTPNQVTNLLRDGELLSLDGAEGLRLPAWQFDPEAKRGRLEGIGRVASVFPGRVLSLSGWMVAPHPALGGLTPRQALLDGDLELVVAVAAHHGA
jgi:hypothetical protein